MRVKSHSRDWSRNFKLIFWRELNSHARRPVSIFKCKYWNDLTPLSHLMICARMHEKRTYSRCRAGRNWRSECAKNGTFEPETGPTAVPDWARCVMDGCAGSAIRARAAQLVIRCPCPPVGAGRRGSAAAGPPAASGRSPCGGGVGWRSRAGRGHPRGESGGPRTRGGGPWSCGRRDADGAPGRVKRPGDCVRATAADGGGAALVRRCGRPSSRRRTTRWRATPRRPSSAAAARAGPR